MDRPDPATDAREYDRAVRARDRLRARATFWDRYRGVALLPMVALGAAAGLLAGIGLRAVLPLPERADAYGAVIGIVAVGRFATSYFDVRKLAVAQRRVEQLAPRRPSGGA